MKAGRQTTLRDQAAVSGIGVHSGLPATLTLIPADADTGIVFIRTDKHDRIEREIRADVKSVTGTEFATGLGIDNASIELDGPEVPIMDGSAAPFVAAIEQAGIVTLTAPRRHIQILKPVRVTFDDAYGELRPHPGGFRLEIEIEFDHPLIRRQALALDLDPNTFRDELARARTFGFMRDVAKLWSSGYALGASFENTLVVTESRVLNPEGLRYADEFVRHKALDAIGDLALAGAPLIGAFKSVRGGHKLNHAVVNALISDSTAWTTVERPETTRRIRGYADVTAGMLAPAYGPEVS